MKSVADSTLVSNLARVAVELSPKVLAFDQFKKLAFSGKVVRIAIL